MNFMIGCNYWDSRSGTEMWVNWDAQTVRKDLEALSRYGVEYLRVFPNWRDFQPLHAMRRWRNKFKEYRLHGKTLMTDEFGLDEACMAHFREFLNIAGEYHIRLVVSLVTGWMSGMTFYPPAVADRNVITDPEAMMLQVKYIRGFVRAFRDSPQICAWDIGNECNCMGPIDAPEQGYVWTSVVRNAIAAEDNTRRIMSGMHSLVPMYQSGSWRIQDQGELCDVLCPHPYPSPTVGGDKDPLNGLRTSVIPTAQLEFYSGIGGKPAMIQESGTFNLMAGNKEYAADFMRISLLSGWANGSLGYLWWCAHEHTHLDFPPYSWGMNERELGILYADRSPKPVALEMQRLNKVLHSLPELPPKQVDAVCICMEQPNWWGIPATAYMLAKEAGISMTFRYHEQIIPRASMYVIPSARGWACMSKETYETVLGYVREGAVALISVDSAFFTDAETVLGLVSDGFRDNSAEKTVDFGGYTLPVRHAKEFLLREKSAEALARDDDGNVIFARNAYGKGYIYFLGFPLEDMLWNTQMRTCDPEKYPYYRIYKRVAEDILASKPVRSENPNVGLTYHPGRDGTLVVAVNYSSTAQNAGLQCAPGVKYECLYGDPTAIAKCDMAVLRLL